MANTQELGTMTAGQMRQLINIVSSSVPANLTFEEAAKLIVDGRTRVQLETLWRELRERKVFRFKVLPLAETSSDYPPPHRMSTESINEILSREVEDTVGQTLDVEFLEVEYLSTKLMKQHLAEIGYRSLSVSETFSLYKRHGLALHGELMVEIYPIGKSGSDLFITPIYLDEGWSLTVWSCDQRDNELGAGDIVKIPAVLL